MKVRRLRHLIDNFQAPAMQEPTNASGGGRDRGGVNLGNHDGGVNVALREHAAPGVDDEGVPKRIAAVLVAAALRRREDKATVPDRARAVEHMPMRLPGLLGE